jgi:hypothetical protein
MRPCTPVTGLSSGSPGLARDVADERLDHLLTRRTAQVDEPDREQAVERVVHLGHHAVELARIRDARAPVGELRGAPRGLERGELAAVEDRRRVGRRAEPRDPHRLRARGEDQRGRAVADRRAVLAAQRRRHGQVRARSK